MNRKSILRRLFRAIFVVCGLTVVGQLGLLGWSSYRCFHAKKKLETAFVECDRLQEWILKVEDVLLGGGPAVLEEFQRIVPVEPDVTKLTERILDEASRFGLDSFRYNLSDPMPWDGPIVEGHKVVIDTINLTLRCSFATLEEFSDRILSRERLVRLRQVTVSKLEHSLQVGMVIEFYRRVRWSGDVS